MFLNQVPCYRTAALLLVVRSILSSVSYPLHILTSPFPCRTVVFASIAGVSDAYPDFKTRVNELATPAGLAELAKVRQRCAPANILAYSNQDVLSTQYFTSGAATLTDPVIQVRCAFDDF